MNADDLTEREKFAVEMTVLAEVYGEQLSEARLEIYFQDLSPYDLEHVIAGMKQARLTRRIFPKIADLAECIDEAVEARVQRHIAETHARYALASAPRIAELMRAGEIRSLPPRSA